jgi:hypothetical protein
MAADACGVVIRPLTKIALSEPASMASTMRWSVSGPGTLSPRSYAATLLSDVPVTRATWAAVKPALRRRSRNVHPSTSKYISY